MDNNKVIELLNKDLKDEHGAIIQYLTHAYGMGEGGMACEIEAMARDEMRHLDWLAETIVELGGIPGLERGTMKMGGTSVHDWMENNVSLEQGAITQYQEHIEAIDDPKIKRLLRRILSDELAHSDKFEGLASEAQKEGAKDVRGTKSNDTMKTLNWGIEHEYTVILQYLLQRYLTPNEEAAEELEDQAINEMQHLGWLAEKVVDMGGTPVIEHTEVDKSTKTADMLSADIKIEQEVANAYEHAATEADDLKLKKLLLRLRDNEVYHAEVFSDLLEEEKSE